MQEKIIIHYLRICKFLHQSIIKWSSIYVCAATKCPKRSSANWSDRKVIRDIRRVIWFILRINVSSLATFENQFRMGLSEMISEHLVSLGEIHCQLQVEPIEHVDFGEEIPARSAFLV